MLKCLSEPSSYRTICAAIAAPVHAGAVFFWHVTAGLDMFHLTSGRTWGCCRPLLWQGLETIAECKFTGPVVLQLGNLARIQCLIEHADAQDHAGGVL